MYEFTIATLALVETLIELRLHIVGFDIKEAKSRRNKINGRLNKRCKGEYAWRK